MDEIIKTSGLLVEKDYQDIEKLHESIRHDFKVKPVFRTYTECISSVLNDIHFPTPHMKYWQSVREQQVHFEELVWLDFNFRKKKVELKKLERQLIKEADDLERELLEIEISQKKYEIVLCEKVGSERVREIKQWDKIKNDLVRNNPNAIFVDNADAGVFQLKGYTKTFILEMFNSGHNVAAADAQNIIGKAITAKNRCKELGIWNDIVKELNLSKENLEALGE